MNKWDAGIIIDGYIVEVKFKQKDGVYYAQANSFFLVAVSGKTFSESLENLRRVFLRVREVVFEQLISPYGIEKAPLL